MMPWSTNSASTTPIERDNLTGLACGMGAGALWGLVFLAPKLIGEFSPLHLTIGRYLCYGLIALTLASHRWRSLMARVSRGQWVRLCWLAFAGNTLFYLLVSVAVQTSGIATTSLVMGFVPVTVTVIGSRDKGSVPFRKLLLSLLLCAAGTVCIGWQALMEQTTNSPDKHVIGILCAVGALVSWTTYAVGNARAMQSLEQVTAYEWNLLIGLITGLQSIAIIPLAFILEPGQHSLDDWTQLAAVSIGLAVLASIIGNALWNRMSHLLPLTLVGQMIVFETLFAMIYGFLWEYRLPMPLELAALAFVVLGVLSCLSAHRKPVRIETTSLSSSRI